MYKRSYAQAEESINSEKIVIGKENPMSNKIDRYKETIVKLLEKAEEDGIRIDAYEFRIKGYDILIEKGIYIHDGKNTDYLPTYKLDIEYFFKDAVTKFLNNMLGECKFTYDGESGLRFEKEIGGNSFVLRISVHNNYIALTNILLPSSMRRCGVSIEILTFLAMLCAPFNYCLYITGIVNDDWKINLLKYGCDIDDDGDIIIDPQKWISCNNIKNIKFVECEGFLILETKVDEFKSIKQNCVKTILNILESWNANIEVASEKGYINRIIAKRDEENYIVEFSFQGINRMCELIKDNNLEEYLKEKHCIGTLFSC